MNLCRWSCRMSANNQPPAKQGVLQCGQVTPSVFTKDDVSQLKKNNIPLSYLGWECLWKSSQLLLVCFVGFFLSRVWILYAFLSTTLFSDVLCGENLFMSSAPFSWSDVLLAWYNEEKNFEYGTGAKTKGAMFGHYTQVDVFFTYIFIFQAEQINVS